MICVLYTTQKSHALLQYRLRCFEGGGGKRPPCTILGGTNVQEANFHFQQVGLGPGHIMLDENPAPPVPLLKKGQSPQFSAPLGTMV